MKIIKIIKKTALFAVILCVVFQCEVNAEKNKNLLPENNAEFESGVLGSDWVSFSGAEFFAGDGISGKGIEMTVIPHSWSSPAIDISEYICEPGTYAFGMALKIKSSEETVSAHLMIRGTKRNSFIVQHGQNYYMSLSSVNSKSDVWTYISGEFEVTQDDIDRKSPWLICLGSISGGTTAVYIDNAELIKGTQKELTGISKKTLDDVNGDVIGDGNTEKKVTFDASVKETFYWALALAVCIATVVIVFKINDKKEVEK